ncbi:VWA domain-containing protein [Candidatus Desantisbacteria bacterium]|nr:VWA domain-containing protein [Candidatus Desantisbacteria bacterium]
MHKKFSENQFNGKYFFIFFIAIIIFCIVSKSASGFMYVPGTKVIKKVIACSDNVVATTKEKGGSEAYKVEIMMPYFVVEDSGDYYKIANLEHPNRHAYVKKTLVMEWNTREGIHFQPSPSASGERTEIKVWDANSIKEYARTGDMKTYPPIFMEDLGISKALPKKLLAFPVVDKKALETNKESGNEIYKKIYKVYIPTYVPETKIRIQTTSNQLENVLNKVTFCVVFDATGSMSKYGTKMAETIEELLKTIELSPKNTKIGFVFFRDKWDKEQIKIVNPVSMEKGIEILREESTPKKMIGGGDAAEPILDALILATKEFKWEVSADSSGGEKKIIIAVLNDDAKTETIGLTKSVEKEQTSEEVVSLLINKDITVFSLQAEKKDGGSLVKILSELANGTGGEFYPSEEDSDSQGRKNFSKKIKELMRKTVYDTETEVTNIIKEMVPSEHGYSIIPLKTLNTEVLSRLQGAAIKYSIENGGFLIREGWMFEKEELYHEKILVEKDFLEDLVRLFNHIEALSKNYEDLTNEELRDAVTENLKSILGEDIPTDIEIQELIEKRMGIHFNTNLLTYSMESLLNLPRFERVEIARQIKRAERKITNFLEAAARDFRENKQVWMELSYLP